MLAPSNGVGEAHEGARIRMGFLIPPGMQELRDFIASLIPLLHETTKPYVDFADIGPPRDSGAGFLAKAGFVPEDLDRDWDRGSRNRSPAVVASEHTLEVMKFFHLKVDDLPCIQVVFAPDFGDPLLRKIPTELCLIAEGRLALRRLLCGVLDRQSIEKVIAESTGRKGSLREAFARHWDLAATEIITAVSTLKPEAPSRARSKASVPRGWIPLTEAARGERIPHATAQRWVRDPKNRVKARKDNGRLIVQRTSWKRLLARKRPS